MTNDTELIEQHDYWIGRFSAMACPCEVLISTRDHSVASKTLEIAYAEARRIEHKFSRYRDDNIIYAINHAEGQPVEVDNETALLLDFAEQCYRLSNGLFDITSGVLREIWQFDGSDRIPDQAQIEQLLSRIGWSKVHWENPVFTLPASMEIDLGGLGKEYAVDQSAKLIAEFTDVPVLVNYGGDIFANAPRQDNTPWIIGVDDPRHTGDQALGQIQMSRGGMATSGDTRRFLLKEGIRYSHILDPSTGWPVADAPRAVTVIANSCVEAGILSTFAMLQGSQAKAFLEAQGVQFLIA